MIDNRVKQRIVGLVVLIGLILACIPFFAARKEYDHIAANHHLSPPAPRLQAIHPSQSVPHDVATAEVTVPPTSGEIEPLSPVAHEPVQFIVEASATLPAAPRLSAMKIQSVAHLPESVEPLKHNKPLEKVKKNVSAKRLSLTASPVSKKVQSSSSTGHGTWTVQLGSFTQTSKAEHLLASLKQKGFPAYSTPLQKGQQTFLRVRVGKHLSQAQAREIAAHIQKSTTMVAVIVNE